MGRLQSLTEKEELTPYLNDFLQNAEGCFNLVVYDRTAETLTITSDSFGLCKVFFSSSVPGRFEISNHYSSLTSKAPCRPDLEAFKSFLKLGFTPWEKTFFNGVSTLNPFYLHQFKERHQELKRPHPSPPENLDEIHRISERFLETLSSVLQSLMQRYSPTHFLLSGGSDSRLITALLDARTRSTLQFMAYKSRHPGSEYDVEVARNLAKHLKLNFETLEIHFENENDCPKRAFKRLPQFMLSGIFGSELVSGIWPSIRPSLSTFFEQDSVWAHPSSEAHQPLTIPESLWRSFFSGTYIGYGAEQFLQPYFNYFQRKVMPFYDSKVVRFINSIPGALLTNYGLYAHIYANQLSSYGKFEFKSEMTRFQRFPQVKFKSNPSIYRMPADQILRQMWPSSKLKDVSIWHPAITGDFWKVAPWVDQCRLLELMVWCEEHLPLSFDIAEKTSPY